MGNSTINIISIVIAALLGLVDILFRIRPRLFWWSTNRRKFTFGENTVDIVTQIITIRNTSFFRTAKIVSIIFDGKIDKPNFHPSKPFDARKLASGEYLLEFKWLHPREEVSIEILGINPDIKSTYLMTVSCSNAKTILKEMKFSPKRSKPTMIFLYILVLLGIFLILKYIMLFMVYLVK